MGAILPVLLQHVQKKYARRPARVESGVSAAEKNIIVAPKRLPPIPGGSRTGLAGLPGDEPLLRSPFPQRLVAEVESTQPPRPSFQCNPLASIFTSTIESGLLVDTSRPDSTLP